MFLPMPLLTISGAAIAEAILWIVIAAVIFWLVDWFIFKYIGIGEPFAKVIRVILAVIVLAFLINALMMLAGKPLFQW